MATRGGPAGQVAAPARPVPILTYHNIGEAPPGATHRGLYLGLDKFRRQLEMLARRGYRGVSMDEGLPYLRGEQRGQVAIVTFDDGYRDNLELALPALREHGFSATCYLVAERIGGYNAWDSELLGVRKPLMDLAGIREWLAAGMRIGSHTLTHPHLPQIEPAQMQREVAVSKSVLEQRLGIAVDHFCFPYGDHDAACVAAAAEAGYRTAVTTERGRVRAGRSLLALPRVGNNGRRSGAAFLARTLLWGLSGSR
ncbi:MAG: polysaccharide deacetylase family protein [Burkholderiales bacterium]|nr:polysaccharide deacetylase family protein [Burkholderiales bacterium]